MDVPFTFVVNAGSGSQDTDAVLAAIERLIPRERQGCFVVIWPGDDFRRALDEAVERCRQTGGVLVAAGGDGTVNAAIKRILPHGLTLAVIPLGTFNYFARQQGIPLDLEEALTNLLEAEPVLVPVCLVNGEPFIVNVSVGLHARIIAARERHTKITGRNRFVALVSGLLTLLREQYSLRARLVLDGHPLQRKAAMVLVGHNRLQLASLNVQQAEAGADDQLAVVVMHQFPRRMLLSLIWKYLWGQLDQVRELELLWARDVRIQLRRTYVQAVLDGELRHFRTPLHIHLQPNALSCLLPTRRNGNDPGAVV